MKISIVVAAGEDGAIGKDGRLIWRIPEDLRHFKELTLGGVVLMGRKTWESLPKHPLPCRRNIVITRDRGYEVEGAKVFNSVDSALDFLEDFGVEEVFVIGGGQIYRETFGLADQIYLTRIHDTCPEADTFFPDLSQRTIIKTSPLFKTPDGLMYHYETLK